ncbi:MAG: iron ABC transporter permease [Candidatus Izimaplasma sp.]|nr:iron ABC transporter permease [Candidatus Izimaplasma bacterium]
MKKWSAKFSIFTALTLITTVLVLLPFSNLFFNLFNKANDVWIHIRTFLLFDYIKNTVLLLVLTGIFSGLIGFFSAYVVTFYEFKYKKLLSWLLILPLALPSYIAAFIYADMFSYTGSFARLLRAVGIHHNFDMMSLLGAAVIFSFTLYPYVYMLVKAGLKKHNQTLTDSAKLLKASPFKRFRTLTLPLSRPALIGGILLVLLETLNDYGVVRYFGVRVFSYAIFDAWFRLGDLSSAIRLSAIVVIFVFIIVIIEKAFRGKKSYNILKGHKPLRLKHPTKTGRIIIYFFLISILLIGFFIPTIEMIFNLFTINFTLFSVDLIYTILNTLIISITATLIIIVIALAIANFGRFAKSKLAKGIVKLTTLGYSIPGAVIAVSVLLFFTKVDGFLYPLYELFDKDTKTLVLTTSLVMLTFAYVLRFLTIGFNTIDASYEKIGTTYTEASYTLQKSKLKTLFLVDIPLIKSGLIAAFIIVFIDIVKELPLTLILRPSNYNTLATTVFIYARDEMIQEASAPALILIIITVIPIYILTHQKRGKNHVR